MKTSDRMRAVADPLIRYGYEPSRVASAVMQALGVGIGPGDAGTDTSAAYPGPAGAMAYCPYCGATRGGGHGEMCPGG